MEDIIESDPGIYILGLLDFYDLFNLCIGSKRLCEVIIMRSDLPLLVKISNEIKSDDMVEYVLTTIFTKKKYMIWNFLGQINKRFYIKVLRDLKNEQEIKLIDYNMLIPIIKYYRNVVLPDWHLGYNHIDYMATLSKIIIYLLRTNETLSNIFVLINELTNIPINDNLGDFIVGRESEYLINYIICSSPTKEKAISVTKHVENYKYYIYHSLKEEFINLLTAICKNNGLICLFELYHKAIHQIEKNKYEELANIAYEHGNHELSKYIIKTKI